MKSYSSKEVITALKADGWYEVNSVQTLDEEGPRDQIRTSPEKLWIQLRDSQDLDLEAI